MFKKFAMLFLFLLFLPVARSGRTCSCETSVTCLRGSCSIDISKTCDMGYTCNVVACEAYCDEEEKPRCYYKFDCVIDQCPPDTVCAPSAAGVVCSPDEILCDCGAGNFPVAEEVCVYSWDSSDKCQPFYTGGCCNCPTTTTSTTSTTTTSSTTTSTTIPPGTTTSTTSTTTTSSTTTSTTTTLPPTYCFDAWLSIDKLVLTVGKNIFMTIYIKNTCYGEDSYKLERVEKIVRSYGSSVNEDLLLVSPTRTETEVVKPGEITTIRVKLVSYSTFGSGRVDFEIVSNSDPSQKEELTLRILSSLPQSLPELSNTLLLLLILSSLFLLGSKAGIL